MPALIDVNVWFALLVERHEHHAAARQWWQVLDPGEAVWIRTTQRGVLRLLTNPKVMANACLSPDDALKTWDWLMFDTRLSFMPLEPSGLDTCLREKIAGREATPKLWTDAYLAAFATAAGLGLVSFDKGFRQLCPDNLILLATG